MGGVPVRDAILNPNQISLYEKAHYDGKDIRLSPGTYYKDDLDGLGFVGARSIMVPFDFVVLLFTTGATNMTSISTTVANLKEINIT